MLNLLIRTFYYSIVDQNAHLIRLRRHSESENQCSRVFKTLKTESSLPVNLEGQQELGRTPEFCGLRIPGNGT